MVVSPGFIDLHQHGQSNGQLRCAGEGRHHDGPRTRDWRRGHQRLVRGPARQGACELRRKHLPSVFAANGDAGLQSRSCRRVSCRRIERAADARTETTDRTGPGAGSGSRRVRTRLLPRERTYEEIVEIFSDRDTARCQLPCAPAHESRIPGQSRGGHRSRPRKRERRPMWWHINSTARDRGPSTIWGRIEQAQASGVDVTPRRHTPTTAAPPSSSLICSTSGKNSRTSSWPSSYGVRTGETLTRETFPDRRRTGGTIIMPPLYSEDSVRRAIASPLVMIASDGMWLSGGAGAHPRSFGTYSRVLGRFVREQGALTLPEAIRKMTLMPAERASSGGFQRCGTRAGCGRERTRTSSCSTPRTVMDRGHLLGPRPEPDGHRSRHRERGAGARERPGLSTPAARTGRARRQVLPVCTRDNLEQDRASRPREARHRRALLLTSTRKW